jgi:hypothetical protein
MGSFDGAMHAGNNRAFSGAPTLKESGLMYVEDHANKTVSHLRDTVSLLREKLAPLTNSSEPDNLPCEKTSRLLSPVMSSIEANLCTLDRLNEDILSLINRTDL